MTRPTPARPARARRRPTRWALVITATLTATVALPGAAFGADDESKNAAGLSPLAVGLRPLHTPNIRAPYRRSLLWNQTTERLRKAPCLRGFSTPGALPRTNPQPARQTAPPAHYPPI